MTNTQTLEWDVLFPLLAGGFSDAQIAKEMKTFWGSTQDDRVFLAAHARQAFFGSIHQYANSWGKEKQNETP